METTLIGSDFFRKMEIFVKHYQRFINYSYGNTNSLELQLAEIRQPIWDFLATACPSFVNRDANAIFSEIFSIFATFTLSERNLFQTISTLTGKCSNCNENLRLNECILFNYITQDDIAALGNFKEWSSLLDPTIRNTSLQYM